MEFFWRERTDRERGIVMSKKTSNAEASIGLERLAEEKSIEHRALLLHAMQSPKKRSMRATSRAVGKTAPTIKAYSKRWRWEERIRNAGAAHDAVAQKIYNEVYFSEFGMREIAVIEKKICAPITVVGTTTQEVASAVKKTISSSAQKADTIFDESLKAQHLELVDRSIQYISDMLAQGEIRVGLKDLPLMIELRSQITGEAEADRQAGSTVIAETIRVKDAKANGGDLIEAMLEDSKELVAIFEALALGGKYEKQKQTGEVE